MELKKETLVSDVVAENYKTAAIFKNYGIDFCCNGKRSIETVAKEINIDADVLVSELLATEKKSSENHDYQSWSLDFLSDYIYQTHHTYVENQIPEIIAYLDKVSNVHGHKHPELFEIYELFKGSAGELTAHMKKEELILFPYIKKIAAAEKNNTPLAPAPFGTVLNPIEMMHEEHDNEGQRFRKIAELSNNYTPPSDACNTFKTVFSLLKEFEEDLHKHIHLENNILFKKAIALESKLNQK